MRDDLKEIKRKMKLKFNPLDENDIKHFTVGKVYKTRGGWDALCIYKVTNSPEYYFIHKPGNEEYESIPIFHDCMGNATAIFTVNGPPSYDGKPADIVEDDKSKERELA